MTFSFQTENFVIQKDTKQGCSAVLNVMVLKSIAAALANNDLFFNKMKFRKRSLYIEIKTILTLYVVLSKQNTICIYYTVNM